jgi:hypothetical protein
MHLIDTQILTRNGPYTVLGQRHEVLWPNGSRIHMHVVHHTGTDEMFLRALKYGPEVTIIDLRKVHPPLADELPAAYDIDRVGLVFYTLRHSLGGAREFEDLARAAAVVAAWSMQRMLEAA